MRQRASFGEIMFAGERKLFHLFFTKFTLRDVFEEVQMIFGTQRSVDILFVIFMSYASYIGSSF